MEPETRTSPIAVPHPPRPAPLNHTRHLSCSFDTPTTSTRHAYLSPDLSPSTASGFPAATPLVNYQSLHTPRTHSCSDSPFTTSMLAHMSAPAAPHPGYQGINGQSAMGMGLYNLGHFSQSGHHSQGGGGGYGSFGYAHYYPSMIGSPLPEQDPFFAPALPPTKKVEKKDRKAKRGSVDSKQPTFLTKLYQAQREYQHIIRWDDKGEVLVIERPEELAEKVLQAVFRQTRFASFSRQLNIYGFMRKVSLKHVDGAIIHPDASTWSHDTLHRDSPLDEVRAMKRRVPPRKSTRASISAQEDLISPSESESDPNDDYHQHLLRDEAQKDRESKHPDLPTLSAPLTSAVSAVTTPANALVPSLPFHTSPAETFSPMSGRFLSPADQLIPLSPRSDEYPFQQELQASLDEEMVDDIKVELERESKEEGHFDGTPATPFPVYPALVRPNFALNFRPSADPSGNTTATNDAGFDMPQTASVFDTADQQFQVSQGHHRTRSFQAEPPTASFRAPHATPFSTDNPLWSADPAYLNGSPLTGVPSGTEGWTNTYTGEAASPPPNSLGMIGAQLQTYPAPPVGRGLGDIHGTRCPSSVPASFAPGLEGTLSLGKPFQFQHPSLITPPSPPDHRHPAPSGTVSPGIYQTSFSPPKQTPSKQIGSPRSPRANPTLITRNERRQSIPSTLYSPRQRPIQSLSLAQLSMSPGRGPLRGLGGMSDGYKSSVMCTPELVLAELPLEVGVVGMNGMDEEEEDLPTAGIKGVEGMESGALRGLLKDEARMSDDGEM